MRWQSKGGSGPAYLPMCRLNGPSSQLWQNKKTLNASNNIASLQSEMEFAASMATTANNMMGVGEVNWEAVKFEATSSVPACSEYIDSILKYVKFCWEARAV